MYFFNWNYIRNFELLTCKPDIAMNLFRNWVVNMIPSQNIVYVYIHVLELVKLFS